MTDETCREPLKEGDEFLQYRIHSLLGRGGHAFVYSGQHLYMERPVAIKVIPAPAEMNSDIYRRAQLEAKILSQLEHPNVVKVYDAGVTDAGVIYIVMEMLEGWPLRAALPVGMGLRRQPLCALAQGYVVVVPHPRIGGRGRLLV